MVAKIWLLILRLLTGAGVRQPRGAQLRVVALAALCGSLLWAAATHSQPAGPVVPRSERDAIVNQARNGLESSQAHADDLESERRTRREATEQLNHRLEETSDRLRQAQDEVKAAQKEATVARQRADSAHEIAEDANKKNRSVKDFVDRFWVLLAAVLVFFMQAGFKCLEVGLGRKRFDTATGLMNLMNWLILCALFYFSYNLMFGRSSGGFLSLDVWRLLDESSFACQPQATCSSGHQLDLTARGLEKLCCNTPLGTLYHPLGVEHFLFQLAFAATTATIVDGAIAERTTLPAYSLIVVGIALFIYPVFGHWAWNPHGWLQLEWWPALHKQAGKHLSFHDFAGSTVVHSVGAWISLVGVHYVGPRRFQQFSSASDARFMPWSRGYAVLGVIMLWFGWWGFNGGSKLRYDGSIASIILNTNLAGAFAGIVAYAHAAFGANDEAKRAQVPDKMIGGVLGGLVAITASCDVMPTWGAMLVGVSAGLVHNVAFDRLKRAKLDDVAGAIPVHGACGVWGTFVASFAPIPGLGSDGREIVSFNGYQILVQALGIATALVFTSIAAASVFLVVDRLIGVRPSVLEDCDGEADSVGTANLRYHGQYGISLKRASNGWSRFFTLGAWLRSEPRTAQSLKQAIDDKHIEIIREDGSVVADQDELNLVTEGRYVFFVCYRRESTSFFAQVLRENEGPLGGRVFVDNAVLAPGQPFPSQLASALATCAVLLVLIGPDWEKDPRLQDPQDWVRRELEQGRANPDTVVFPILVDRREMPKKRDLPLELSWLPDVHGLHWDSHQLYAQLRKLVPTPPAQPFRNAPDWFGSVAFGGLKRLLAP